MDQKGEQITQLGFTQDYVQDDSDSHECICIICKDLATHSSATVDQIVLERRSLVGQACPFTVNPQDCLTKKMRMHSYELSTTFRDG